MAWLSRVGWSASSALREAERLKDAIWAADLLKVIRSDVHLLIFGDGPHRDRLLQFRDQVLIRDKVHFLGQPSDAAEAMAHLDVLWSAGGTGESAAAVLAAMAAGVPVVAADTPAMRELIAPGQTGCLFRLGQRAGLAAATQQLLESPEAARRRACSRISLPKTWSAATRPSTLNWWRNRSRGNRRPWHPARSLLELVREVESHGG